VGRGRVLGELSDRSIVPVLRSILVSTQHNYMANVDRALLQITVTRAKRELFGLTQAREEPKLIEVAHRLTPFGVNPEDRRRLIPALPGRSASFCSYRRSAWKPFTC
jgi:hypothetical protein